MKRICFAAILGLVILRVTAVAADPRAGVHTLNRSNISTLHRTVGYRGNSLSSCDCAAGPTRAVSVAPCGQCGECVSNCRCCPSLIGMVLDRIDCVVQQLCHRVVTPRCLSCASTCGCDSGCVRNWSPTSTTNPFQDDEFHSPPPVPLDTPDLRPIRSSTLPRARLAATHSVMKERVEPRAEQPSAVKIHIADHGPGRSSDQEVQPIQFENVNVRKYPKNPLRDEK